MSEIKKKSVMLSSEGNFAADPKKIPEPLLSFVEPNTSLIADAGTNQAVCNEITLDGSNSADSDGEIISYYWELRHRENSEYNKSAEGKIVTISGLERGFYEVTLTVSDNKGLQGNDEMLLSSRGHIRGDINSDNRIGLEDAVYVLKTISGHK